jgi:hypothetical protein
VCVVAGKRITERERERGREREVEMKVKVKWVKMVGEKNNK